VATKEQFLGKLAGKLGRERIHQAAAPKFQHQPWDHLHKELDQEGLVNQFGNELMKLGGVVIPVQDEASLAAAVEAYMQENGFSRLIVWPAGEALGAEIPDPADDLQSKGIKVTRWSSGGSRDELIAAAEIAQAGLVYATHAISETGSIVLYNRGDRGRLVSLLPNQFLAVVRASTVVPRITQVLKSMAAQVADYSCINIITGPSRTSDIEMDLTIGVHGPGRITIFLIEDHL
jgi:L-lactate dehydrogenase complex protein LldG